jgi:hypothetical protein
MYDSFLSNCIRGVSRRGSHSILNKGKHSQLMIYLLTFGNSLLDFILQNSLALKSILLSLLFWSLSKDTFSLLSPISFGRSCAHSLAQTTFRSRRLQQWSRLAAATRERLTWRKKCQSSRESTSSQLCSTWSSLNLKTRNSLNLFLRYWNRYTSSSRTTSLTWNQNICLQIIIHSDDHDPKQMFLAECFTISYCKFFY